MSSAELPLTLVHQRKALRTWFLVVGISLFAVDVLSLYAYRITALSPFMRGPVEMSAEWNDRLLFCYLVVLAAFVALWSVARERPVLCCVAGVAGYWATHAVLAAISPEISLGVLIKLAMMISLAKLAYLVRRSERLVEVGETDLASER
jgi:hypothetical protein